MQAAKETASRARNGVRTAHCEYVPDIGAFARRTDRSGVPFVAHSFGAFGLRMTWDIFDWGKRKSVVGQRAALLEQAEHNLRRVADLVSVEVDKAYRKKAELDGSQARLGRQIALAEIDRLAGIRAH